ncbi:enoyl-CoA hydratase [Corynebacterium sp. MC-04]|uniref:Enoyl-CoA hydratase n=1 Tax=Corynebacterium parakroppenstedtii TaxID=2828363 RepID=A0ABS9HJI6_9CORY|nr:MULTISPECIES: enoyl-CoA hydratase [Corynebacterium]MDU3198236.1 enoyl-CoA hydratase [Corynebacterium kroppenstedtii]MBY0788882.1 enoyl-CoA hydratase [Corynebacterium parakroppenstedtii]MBY0792945.1 enoyl-CoA hydratase [Corynebacterium parakroppenstedtii]MBY0797733.1 enoyl-CoA hydratase [Corynebacterium parakroppenstedtii]MCF6769449.1 enoyl-CoA hydratase [Corynebacterium parakroppenstedtii]
MTNENNVTSASPDGEVTLDILPVDNDTPTDGEPQPQVAVITIRRDHKRNALNADVCGQIATYVHEAENTESVRAILLRGEGKAFCAGADLAGGVYTSAFHHNLDAMLTSITHSPLPVIADVHGPAVGAGTQLAMACDLRVVGESGWFSVPVVRLGIAVDPWTIHRAVELLGGARARSFLYTAERIGPDAAISAGLASSRGNHDDAWQVAVDQATNAPLTLRYLKAVFNQVVPTGVAQGGSSEGTEDNGADLTALHERLRTECWDSEDAAEARAARSEKRSAVFKGK